MSPPPGKRPGNLPGKLGLPDGLRRKRWLARAALLFERAWVAAWPALGVAGGFVCAALLGVFAHLPAWLHAALIAATLAGAGVLAWRGLRSVGIPDEAAGDRRLERDSGLRHRPLVALGDRAAPGSGDPDLWSAYLARVAASIGRLRVSPPSPGLAARDPRAVRALLLVGLAASVGIAGRDAPMRLLAAWRPGFAATVPTQPAKLQAWVTPPGFTGMPPLLLSSDRETVSVPSGSRLVASLSGGHGSPSLSLGGVAIAWQPTDGDGWQATTDLTRDGVLEARRGGEALGRWRVVAVTNTAPVVQWAASPEVVRGRPPRVKLAWQVSHPYGVTSARAELRLLQRPEAAPLVVDLPLSGGSPRAGKGARVVDLTAHPWAGLPVTARLTARDTGGLTGASDDRQLTLPERRFQHPAAQALVATRKLLALRPDDRAPPLASLERLAADDTLWQADHGGYLNLRAAALRLMRAPRGTQADPVIDAVQDQLWQLALHLEEESPARTAEALARARKELKSALEQERRAAQDGAPRKPGELARREQELKAALERHLQALQQQARRDPQRPAPSAKQQEAAERALDKLREATESGDMKEAEQQQAELEQALDEIEQSRKSASTSDKQKRRSEARQKGRRQMGVLQDIIRREVGVLDHAQLRTRVPDAPRSLLDFPPLPRKGADEDAARASRQESTERSVDQRVQRALRRALGEMMQQYGDLTGDVPSFLGDADRAMRDATDALAAARDESASGAAQRAIEALQQGSQSMSQQLAQQFGRERGKGGKGQGEDGDSESDDGEPTSQGQAAGPGDEGEPGEGQARTGQRLDPFGRALREGEAGSMDGGDTAVPDTMEQARTRAVQDELRRRGAERSRPRHELDYIGRLLDTQ